MSGQTESARLGGSDQSSRPRSSRTLAASALLLLFGLLWLLTGQISHEPVYGGKTLTLWLRTYDPSSPLGRGSREWNETDDAVRHIGTNAIPFLLRMLRETDSSLKLALAALAQRQRFIKIHFVPATTRNIEASKAFIVLGDAAKDAVPDLMKAYDENNSIESRSAIEEALSWIGPGAESAVPLLLQAATNANNEVRANALWALGDIHCDAQVCVPVLIRALGDSDSGARLSAAHALGMFGTEAQSAIPALSEMTKPPKALAVFSITDEVPLEARNALRKINPDAHSPSGQSSSAFEIRPVPPTFPPR